MKKTMKRLIALIAVLVMAISVIPTASAARIGDVIGYAQPTDIVATINGYQIESYNVNGYTYICVEDLRYYGFDVYYDWGERALYVSRNSVYSIDPQNTNPNFWYIGNDQNWKNILYTDIATYANGSYIESYNINGQTIMNFDELSRFGDVSYDNNRREISLYIDDMYYNAIATIAELYEDNIGYNEDWTYRVRAKGDLLMFYVTTRRAENQSTVNDYLYTKLYEDKAIFCALLDECRDLNLGVSNIYVELRNADGSYITSFYAE